MARTGMANTQLFSSVAREYANFRPGYPPELFAWLASEVPRREMAWDCGCGSGQASVALAAHFDAVIATDASAPQIAAATPHPGVSYRVAPAEASGLDAASVDLITVAQALHWFDVAAFYREARRVARPGALLAAWTYTLPEPAEPAARAAFDDFYRTVVGPYWPPERRHVESRYTTLEFPAPWVAVPEFQLSVEWSLAQLLGYVSSWSATARCRAATGADPVAIFEHALAPLWGQPLRRMAVRFPLTVLATRF
jgi:ubiquinone/menaquinone biosynthesis C-methylase UbiE